MINKSVELENEVNKLQENIDGVSSNVEEKNISDIAFEDYVKNRINGSALTNMSKAYNTSKINRTSLMSD